MNKRKVILSYFLLSYLFMPNISYIFCIQKYHVLYKSRFRRADTAFFLHYLWFYVVLWVTVIMRNSHGAQDRAWKLIINTHKYAKCREILFLILCVAWNAYMLRSYSIIFRFCILKGPVMTTCVFHMNFYSAF